MVMMPTMITMLTRIVKLGTQTRATLAPPEGFGTYPKGSLPESQTTTHLRTFY